MHLGLVMKLLHLAALWSCVHLEEKQVAFRFSVLDLRNDQ